MPVSAVSSAWLPAALAPGDRWRSRRAPGDASSSALVPTRGNTHRSRGTPRDAALAAETISTAEAWSTLLLAIIAFVYGAATIRLSSDGVAIWAAVIGVRTAAWGLSTATALNPAQRAPIRHRWLATDSPRAWRIAVSING